MSFQDVLTHPSFPGVMNLNVFSETLRDKHYNFFKDIKD